MKQAHDGRAGGSVLAFSIIAGAVAGMIAGETSIGLAMGTAVGAMLLGLIWLRDRPR